MEWIIPAGQLALSASVVVALWAIDRWMRASQKQQAKAIKDMEGATRALGSALRDRYKDWEHHNQEQLQFHAQIGFMMPSRHAPVALAQEVANRLPEGWMLYLACGAEQYCGCYGWPNAAEIEVLVWRRSTRETD